MIEPGSRTSCAPASFASSLSASSRLDLQVWLEVGVVSKLLMHMSAVGRDSATSTPVFFLHHVATVSLCACVAHYVIVVLRRTSQVCSHERVRYRRGRPLLALTGHRRPNRGALGAPTLRDPAQPSAASRSLDAVIPYPAATFIHATKNPRRRRRGF